MSLRKDDERMVAQHHSDEKTEEAEEKNPVILNAIRVAIDESSAKDWDPETQQPIIVEALHGKLKMVHENHPDFKIGANEAITELEAKLFPKEFEAEKDIDIFADDKNRLVKAGINRSAMTLVVKLFRESLSVLSKGYTTRQLREIAEQRMKPKPTGTTTEQARRSERGPEGKWKSVYRGLK